MPAHVWYNDYASTMNKHVLTNPPWIDALVPGKLYELKRRVTYVLAAKWYPGVVPWDAYDVRLDKGGLLLFLEKQEHHTGGWVQVNFLDGLGRVVGRDYSMEPAVPYPPSVWDDLMAGSSPVTRWVGGTT